MGFYPPPRKKESFGIGFVAASAVTNHLEAVVKIV